MKKLSNAKGNIYYGMHFYPGVAQYDDPEKGSSRVFLNENTIRSMDPSFAGCPIFAIDHVDDVNPNIDRLRSEADGWVIESFYNSADGKHWVKFVVVSEKGERAIKNGMRLSNAYIPKKFAAGGLWNGVSYQEEIVEAEYEHLAIVRNPRYEESVILTPEQFKKYNEDNLIELRRIANSKEKRSAMKPSFYKYSKVENAIDPELRIQLPKSGKFVSVQKLINDAYEKDQDPAMEKKQDSAGESAASHSMANVDHMVKMHDGSYMKVKDMMNRYKSMNDDLEDMKKKKEDSGEKEMDLKTEPSKVEVEGDLHNDPDSEHQMDDHEEKVAEVEHEEEIKDTLENPEEVVHDEDEDEKAKKKALQLAEHEDKEIEEAKKKKNAKEKADRLRNAHLKANAMMPEIPPPVELSYDRVERGKQRYGS